MPDAFADAIDALTGPTPSDTALAAPTTDALPINGVAISTLGNFLGNETVSASDALAARLDELQFDLGEGACWDAFASRRPVLEPNIRQPKGVWPAFSDALRHHDIGAVYVFPLFVGPFATGRSMQEIAEDIVERRLNFSTRETGIEESP